MLPKTAFVTGGTGFLGLNLIEHLTASGWEVTALHRPSSNLVHLQQYPVRLVEGLIEDPLSLDRAMPENIAVIFHVAADTSMWPGHRQRQWRTNVDGTRNMLKAARAKGCKRFIHTSTSGVFGLPNEAFDETAAKLGKGNFNYQHSKAMAEEEVARAVEDGLDAVILNPANIIGRYDRSSWSTFIRKAANGELLLIPAGRACFCDVGSVVRAHVAAVDRGRTGNNYLLGGDQATYLDVVRLVGKLLQKATNSRVGNPWVFSVAGRALDRLSEFTKKEPVITAESAAFLNANIICRSDKATIELGYRPTSLEAMFRECIDWMIEEKLLT
jgi:nucleoside-diphosphate-sugar epimerase